MKTVGRDLSRFCNYKAACRNSVVESVIPGELFFMEHAAQDVSNAWCRLCADFVLKIVKDPSEWALSWFSEKNS